jgi:putrescine aminotransferase
MAQAVTSATRDLDLKHLWHGNLQHHGLEARPPLEVASAEGCYVIDADGRRYLDGMAGLFCVNVGYGRREIVDAVAAQMTQLVLPTYAVTVQRRALRGGWRAAAARH